MKKLIVVIGDSGSGKTTFMNHLITNFPDLFEKVITYTSRKKRDGEREGVDYFFRDVKFFEENTNLILVKKSEDEVHYGTPSTCLISERKKHLLLGSRPTAISKLIKLGAEQLVAVHLSGSENVLSTRINQRDMSEYEKNARSRWDQQYDLSDLNLIEHLHLNSEEPLKTMSEKLLEFLSN